MSILINGTAYAHANIIPIIGGVPVQSVSAISYGEDQEKEDNFGTGNRPHSRGRGPIKAKEVSITISMNEVERIRDAAPNGSLVQIPPFDIPITYNNGSRIVSHIIKNAEFTDDGVESNTGDKDIAKSFSLIASNVQWRPGAGTGE